MPTTNAWGPFELLRQLTELSGVSGREERVREFLRAQTDGFWDETTVDPLGNLICVKRATRKPPRGTAGRDGRTPRVMLACHMDEIGFYVRHIDDHGFLRLHNLGGFDTRNLFARRVVVQGKRDLLGVMNPTGKPIHMASDEDKKKIPQINDFYVDLFLPKGDVLKLVEIGDPVTLAQSAELVGDAVTAKALDNRVALWAGINAVRRAHGLDYLIPGEIAGRDTAKPARRTRSSRAKAEFGSPYDIYFVACVQEEVGLRGSMTAAYAVEPEIGIAIDTTLACDTPGTGKEEAITELGQGVALKLLDSTSISHRGLFDEFVALARKHKIAHQREILPRGGTDAGSVQRARAGTRTITISIPTRYIHTVTEAVHRRDALAAVDLLAAYLRGA